MGDYLRATKRSDLATACEQNAENLRADAGAKYDQVIEINLSELAPHINGPMTPDLAHPISAFSAAVKKNGWPEKLSAALIGSCTNSSYEDMSRCAALAKQAMDAGLKSKVPFLVTPGSEQIRATIDRDGLGMTITVRVVRTGAGLQVCRVLIVVWLCVCYRKQ